MPLRSLSFKLFKGQMWRLCLTDIFPTASKPSRGCSELGQVAHTSWRQKCQLLLRNKFLLTLHAMLAEGLLDSHFYNNATQKHSLVIAGVGDVPVEIDRGVRIDQHDLCSSHEEADIHITQHAIALRLLCLCFLFTFTIVSLKLATPPPPQCSCHHQWKNEQWSIFLPLQKHTVT